MPYVITTLAANFPPEAGHTVSRQAVATLGGRAIWNAFYGVDLPNREDVVEQIAHLPESGGTVGPLPDGTVIEVELKDKFYLAGVVPHDRYMTEAELIAAFNSREPVAR